MPRHVSWAVMLAATTGTNSNGTMGAPVRIGPTTNAVAACLPGAARRHLRSFKYAKAFAHPDLWTPRPHPGPRAGVSGQPIKTSIPAAMLEVIPTDTSSKLRRRSASSWIRRSVKLSRADGLGTEESAPCVQEQTCTTVQTTRHHMCQTMPASLQLRVVDVSRAAAAMYAGGGGIGADVKRC